MNGEEGGIETYRDGDWREIEGENIEEKERERERERERESTG